MKLIIEYQYFPPIILFKILFKQTNIEFELYENWQKGGFRNRTLIASPTGVVNLSIPVVGGRDVRKPVKEVEIDHGQRWQLHHIKTLKNYYCRSPWFENYLPELEELYAGFRPRYLYEWNRMCFTWTCAKLGLSAKFTETSAYQKIIDEPGVLNLRNKLRPSGYTNYGDFLPNIALPEYPQVYAEKTGFLPNLGILDLLFCEGPAAARLLH